MKSNNTPKKAGSSAASTAAASASAGSNSKGAVSGKDDVLASTASHATYKEAESEVLYPYSTSSSKPS